MIPAHVTTISRTPAGQWRIRRHACEAASLRRDLQHIIVAHPRLRLMGGNPFVASLARQFELAPDSLAIVAIRLDRRDVTIVSTGPRIWRSVKGHSHLLELKHTAHQAGYFIILVPKRAVRREPRLSNARLIASHKDLKVSPENRAAIVHHVGTNPGATLWSCSEVVRGVTTPTGCVLALIAQGVLAVRLDQRLNPSSPVQFNTSRSSRAMQDHQGKSQTSDQAPEVF